MTDTKVKNSDIIAARKSGKALSAIAAEFEMDKMDVRDICKDVQRVASKKADKKD